ncbi:MAG: hypothetical protein LAN71_17815 [Acidobacteriia bacterium]|nr:hypothetical protein [Terriglobia bacterium]
MDPNKANPQEPKVETPVEKKEAEYSNEELHRESMNEIAKNEELPKEEPKVEEKPEETPKVEEKKIEPEELVEQIATKVKEKLTPEEKKVAKNKYEEFFEKTVAEKGREPNWAEVSQFLEDQAVARMEEKQKEAWEAQEKIKTEENIAREAMTKRFDAQVDEEIEEIYKSGNLTAVKDSNNPSDQGVLERKALFQAMLDENIKRNAQGKEPILSVARIFYGGYYTKPNAQPAGVEAPISMGTGTPSGGGEEQEINYMKDIKKPWSFFKQIRSR